MKLELTTNESALEEVVKQSGLQLTESDEIKGAYLPFLSEFSEILQRASTINADSPTKEDEKLASESRKKIVKIRTGAETVKEDRKKIHLIKGNLEQASFNVIKNSCLLAEEAFRNVEEFSARQESARKLKLKEERTAILSEYCDNPTMYPLSDLTEDAFSELLEGFKLQKAAKEKAEQDRLEAERLLAEQKEKERIAYEAEQERIRKENEALKTEADRKEKVRVARNEELRPYIVFIRDYKAMLDMEEIEYQKELSEVKKGAELQWEHDRKEMARKAKEDADRIKQIEKERAEAKKIADELKAKQDAENEAKRLAEEAEKKRIADEKKLAKAPDKEKLKAWLNTIVMPDIPNGLSNESGTIGLEISNKFDNFKNWAIKQIETL